jgi:hypothetical protein
MGMKKTYTGSCHCGAVKFQANLDMAQGTNRCNCSFCRKARFWMALAKSDEFQLLEGEQALADYQRTPPNMTEPFLHLHFCRHCGVRPFTKGGFLPSMGSAFYAVNLACLDNVTDEELAHAPINFVDGLNGTFGPIEGETRHL